MRRPIEASVHLRPPQPKLLGKWTIRFSNFSSSCPNCPQPTLILVENRNHCCLTDLSEAMSQPTCAPVNHPKLIASAINVTSSDGIAYVSIFIAKSPLFATNWIVSSNTPLSEQYDVVMLHRRRELHPPEAQVWPSLYYRAGVQLLQLMI